MLQNIIELDTEKLNSKFKVKKYKPDSETYLLYDLKDNKLPFFLKDISTLTILKNFPIKKPNKKLLKLEKCKEYYYDLHSTISKLIPTESLVDFYPGLHNSCYVITEKIGCNLVDASKLFSSETLYNHAKSYFNQICNLISQLHVNSIRHSHPHGKNFTIHNNQIHLIDIAEAMINPYLKWEASIDYLGTPHFLNVDFSYLPRAFLFPISWMRIDNPREIRYKQLEGFLKIIEKYPCNNDLKYEILKKKTLFELGLNINHLDSKLIKKYSYLERIYELNME